MKGYYQALADVERELLNAARRNIRKGGADKASAYRYAAWLIRRVLKDLDGGAA